MPTTNIVVLGAGVSGLTTAYILGQKPCYKITVIAKHMPGDYDIDYCSPWAGANYLPVGRKGGLESQLETETWAHLKHLAEKRPEAGIHFQKAVVYNREKDQKSTTGEWFAELVKVDPWFRDVVPDFQRVPLSALPPEIDNASTFTSVCINTAMYLPWLVGQCQKRGVVFKRAALNHITQAAKRHHLGFTADVVINCTDLASCTLGGVNDGKVYPIRGQIVMVRNDPGYMCSISGTDDGDDEVTYVMSRAAGGGTILGGSYQKHKWDSQPDPTLAVRIMKRCVELCPELVAKGQGIEGLDVIRHAVGLRPYREGGPRVEKDELDDVSVIHNYGHGGYGYQTSFGCALKVMDLVKTVEQKGENARL